MKIIDLGCCIGLFTDYCLEKYDNIEKIYAFEPLRCNYEFIKEKYKDNSKVEVFHKAISNYEGTANFFKKNYKDGYDWVGNAGSSLKSEKTNVNADVYEAVDVTTVTKFLSDNNIDHVDIIKIDTEGSEYDILENMMNSIDKFDKIYFEDHVHKVPTIRQKKEFIMNEIKERDILHKFYIQGAGHIDYTALVL